MPSIVQDSGRCKWDREIRLHQMLQSYQIFVICNLHWLRLPLKLIIIHLDTNIAIIPSASA